MLTKRFTILQSRCLSFVAVASTCLFACESSPKASTKGPPVRAMEVHDSGRRSGMDTNEIIGDGQAQINPTKEQISEQEVILVAESVRRFSIIRRRLPNSIAELRSVPTGPPGLPFRDRWLTDERNHRLRYKQFRDVAGAFEVRSAGKDGVFFSADDHVATESLSSGERRKP
jgi:hypothetical protein